MKLNKPVQNPMLIGAIQLLKADGSDEHKNLFATEFAKAELITPVSTNPGPINDEFGNITLEEGAEVKFPMLNSSDGKRFFALFTDLNAMRANVPDGAPMPPSLDFYMTLTAADLGEIISHKSEEGPDRCDGVVINPFAENIVIGKELPLEIYRKKDEIAESLKEEDQ